MELVRIFMNGFRQYCHLNMCHGFMLTALYFIRWFDTCIRNKYPIFIRLAKGWLSKNVKYCLA